MVGRRAKWFWTILGWISAHYPVTLALKYPWYFWDFYRKTYFTSNTGKTDQSWAKNWIFLNLSKRLVFNLQWICYIIKIYIIFYVFIKYSIFYTFISSFTNFVNELMKVWRTLSTCWEIVKIWTIGTHNSFQTCRIKVFFLFLKQCWHLILLTHQSTLEL